MPVSSEEATTRNEYGQTRTPPPPLAKDTSIITSRMQFQILCFILRRRFPPSGKKGPKAAVAGKDRSWYDMMHGTQSLKKKEKEEARQKAQG